MSSDPPPPAHPDSAILAQILTKQGEMGVQLAVISEQLRAIPDHETRIRLLESARAKLTGAAVAAGTLSGGLATLIYWALSRR
jgi:hypothetical protein